MYSTLAIADYIIAKGGGKLTPLQVIKLAYISHGFTLAILKHGLLSDPIEAWKYGPVVPPMYDALKEHGSDPVSSFAYCDTKVGPKTIKERIKFLEGVIPEEERAVLDRVIETHKHLSGTELLKLTHRKGSPWTRHYIKGELGTVIPDGTIKKHYQELLANAGA